jgi:hypothetical protein
MLHPLKQEYLRNVFLLPRKHAETILKFAVMVFRNIITVYSEIKSISTLFAKKRLLGKGCT